MSKSNKNTTNEDSKCYCKYMGQIRGRRQFVVLLLGAVATFKAEALMKLFGNVQNNTAESHTVIRSVSFPEGTTLDERLVMLEGMVEAKKMRQILREFKDSGKLLDVVRTNLAQSIVYKYDLDSLQSKKEFEARIRSVRVIQGDVRALA